MSGSIMPTPLATPTTAGGVGPVAHRRRRGLGERVGGHHPGGDAHGVGLGERAAQRGQVRPDAVHRVLPTDHAGGGDQHVLGRAAAPRRRRPRPAPRRWPAPRRRSRRSRSSTRPRRACSEPSAACARDTSTLGPAKRDRVKTAAAVHGRSDATTTKSSVSSLIPMLATWAWKPRGSGTVLIGSEVWHGPPAAGQLDSAHAAGAAPVPSPPMTRFDSALDLAAAIRDRRISPTEALEGYLDRVDRLDPTLNAFALRDDERARADAAAATELVASTPVEELPPFLRRADPDQGPEPASRAGRRRTARARCPSAPRPTTTRPSPVCAPQGSSSWARPRRPSSARSP